MKTSQSSLWLQVGFKMNTICKSDHYLPIGLMNVLYSLAKSVFQNLHLLQNFGETETMANDTIIQEYTVGKDALFVP